LAQSLAGELLGPGVTIKLYVLGPACCRGSLCPSRASGPHAGWG